MRTTLIACVVLCASLAHAGTLTARGHCYKPTAAESGYDNEVNDCFDFLDNGVESPGDWIQTSPATETDEFDDTSVDGKWSWVNQGGATVTEQSGYSLLTTPADSSISFRVRVQTAPSTPWTITARLALGGKFAFYMLGGLCIMDNSGGDIRLWGHDDVADLRVFSIASTTSTPGTVYTTPARRSTPQYLRITNDGTNLIYFSSHDGAAWVQEHTETISGSLGTVDRIGFCAGTTNSTATPLVLYWFRKS